MKTLSKRPLCSDCGYESWSCRCRKRICRQPQGCTGPRLRHGTSFTNNKAIRSQLWAVYTSEYKKEVRNCFIDAVTFMDLSPTALSNTLDAITLAHAATTTPPNESLRYQAMESYGRALGALAQSLSTMPKNLKTNNYMSRAVLISMMLIGSCNNSLCDGPSLKITSTTIHYKAVERYIKAIGPDAFDTNNAHEVNLLQAAWFIAFVSNLSMRKAMTLSVREWNFFSTAMCEGPGKAIFAYLDGWFRMIIPVPGLLEQIDKNLVDQASPDDRLRVLAMRAMEFSRKASSYIGNLCLPQECLPTGEQLDVSIEEHMFLANSKLFQEQYYFYAKEMGMLWLVTHFTCLLAKCAVLRVLIARSSMDDSPSLAVTTIERDTFDTAKILSKSVYFTSKIPSPTFTVVLSTILEVLGAFFSESGAVEELGWCHTCNTATKLRLERLEKVRPRSLCRIREVAPLLTAAVRYKSPMEVTSLNEGSSQRCPYG